MRRAVMLSLVGVAVLAAGAVGATSAGATLGYVNACNTLSTLAMCVPNEGGPPAGLAVDNSTGASAGDVWFLGYNPARLINYDASGELLQEVLLNKRVGLPISVKIAVDPASGDVYVSSDAIESRYLGNRTNEAAAVTKLTPSGEVLWEVSGAETPQGSFGYVEGVVVEPVTDDVYVADRNREVVDVLSPEGKYLSQFPVAAGERSITDLAMDSNGDLFVGLEGKEPQVTTQVGEYTSAGAPVNCPSTSSNVVYESPLGEDTDGAIAVDPSDDHLFIFERSAEGDYVAEYAAPCASPTLTFGEGGELSGAYQFGVYGATHAVYLGSGALFELVPIPSVATGAPATSIARFSASVSGTVNPEGATVIGCEFEYGAANAFTKTQNTYTRDVPCELPAGQSLPLEGTSPIAVSAKLEGLGPNVLYHYRLRALLASGSRVGVGETFTTEALSPPVLGALPASGVSQFAATLNSSLAPGEAIVDYHFEYGTTTAYGSIEPIPDDYTPITNETVPVSQPVQGLQAGTTYHYRLVASSPGGTEAKGPDETFTTLPVPAPTVATGAASGVGVGSATLSGTIDPHGWDTTYLFEYGTSTSYGQSWPTVQVDMGALEGPQPVVVNVPNLQPNTTYHYRLLANNGGGTSYGQDMTFTTGEYPAQVIQEPTILRTLLVPSEVVKSSSKKGKKAKKTKKHPKSKRKARRKKKR